MSKLKFNVDEFVQLCKDKNLEILEFKKTLNDYSKFRCTVCSKEFDTKPTYIINKDRSCPRCKPDWSPRRITTEYYKDDIEYKHKGKYTILGEYINNKQTILTRCNTCSHEWYIRPNDLLSNGHGCPECSKRRNATILSKPDKDYINEIYNLSKGRLSLSIVNNSNIIQCNTCNTTWKVDDVKGLRNRLVRNNDLDICPTCKTHVTKYTPNDITEKLKEIYNEDYIIQDDYVDVNTMCSIKHGKCGNIYKARPGSLLYKVNSSLCPCTRERSRSKTEDEIVDFIKDNYKHDLQIISINDRSVIDPYELDIYIPELNLAIEYNGLYWHSNMVKEDIRVDIHQYKSLLCYNKGIRLIQIFDDQWNDETKDKLLTILDNPKIYIDNSLQWGIPINQDCIEVNEPNKVYLKYGKVVNEQLSNNYTYDCGTYSILQDKLEDMFNSIGVEYKTKVLLHGSLVAYNINRHVFVYVNQKEVNVYNGYGNKYLYRLRSNLINKGYNVVFIYGNDIVKYGITLSKIKHILHLNDNPKVYARNCYVKEISSADKNKFLEDNHIQGKDSAKIKLGLYHNDKLVSVMTFCKPRVSLGHKEGSSYDYELSRFASDIDLNVIGGYSKLFKYFERNYKWKSLITYADKKYSNGNLYIRNNWKLKHESEPSYNYIDSNRHDMCVENRFKYRKNNLKNIFGDGIDNNMTEKDILHSKGYYQYYNIGNYVFEYFRNIEKKNGN